MQKEQESRRWRRNLESQKALTFRRATIAAKFSVVVRVSVVAGQFFAGSNGPQRIKLDSSVSDPDEDVGIAGVIHELKEASVYAAVHSLGFADLDDGDTPRILGSPPGFAH